MIAPPARPLPDRVPTLTEVVGVARRTQPGALAAAAAQPRLTLGTDGPVPPVGADERGEQLERPPSRDELDEARLVAQVMTELQARIDLMLEYRLREALAPLLARAAEQLVQDARAELALTLRDVVARAVTQEVTKNRLR